MSVTDVEVGKVDFDFYAKFARPLILTLTNTEDRILASAWFSKLRDETSGPDKLRLDYLKLLLFVLQRHKLAGPFIENPNAQEELQQFGESYDLAKLAREIIENEQKEKREKCLQRMRGEIGDFPPFSTDYSPDLREYVAAQDIPNFGVHVYYAISKDPILDWENPHHAVFPRGVKRMEPQGHISETSFAHLEAKHEPPDESEKCKIMEETGVMPDDSIFVGRKTRARKSPFVDVDRPAPPLGVLPGDGEAAETGEELPHPTWGSNLIEVREPIERDGPEVPETKEPDVSAVPSVVSSKSIAPDDPEIVDILETSFNMEDIMAEVDAFEMDVSDDEEGGDVSIDEFLQEEAKFREMEVALDKHDAFIDAVIAELDEDEQKMLKEPTETPSPPKKEVKVVADDDTVIKVLVETPEVAVETREEKKRKESLAESEKKKKPLGRTGLSKTSAKGAILKPSEKQALEEEEQQASIVTTKTGVPTPSGLQKRPGVPKPKVLTEVKATTSADAIPAGTTTPVRTGIPGRTGIPTPGRTGIPTPGRTGIPPPGRSGIKPPGRSGIKPPGSGVPQVGSKMIKMTSKLNKMLKQTKDRYGESGGADSPRASGIPSAKTVRKVSPVEQIPPASKGSPEADEICNEDKEFQILERLYELYQQLEPDKPEGMRTPPIFSKHPQIRALGQQLQQKPLREPGVKFQHGPDFMATQKWVQPIDQRFWYSKRPTKMRANPFADDPYKRPPIEELIGPNVVFPDDDDESSEDDMAVWRPAPEPPKPPEPRMDDIRHLREIVKRAEERVDTSPVLKDENVALTTPKSPPTPKRLRRNLMTEFDEEPPEFPESPPPTPPQTPPFSPPKLGTPEFVRIPTYGFPDVVTEEHLERMYAEKKPEFDAYVQAEIEAERSHWEGEARRPLPYRQLLEQSQRSPVAGPSTAVTPPQPIQMPYPPGSVGRPPGTPPGLPKRYRYEYRTPPWVRIYKEDIPSPIQGPEFDDYTPEDLGLGYEIPPELEEASFDEWGQSIPVTPEFEGLQDWQDPLAAIAEKSMYEMGLDMPEEFMPDLVEFQSPQLSPMSELKRDLDWHDIEPEFRDPSRPLQDKVVVLSGGAKSMRIRRRSVPTGVARRPVQEDVSGEEFEMLESKMEEEVEEFIKHTITDEGRAERLAQLAEEAINKPALLEEDEPSLELAQLDEFPERSPEMTKEEYEAGVQIPENLQMDQGFVYGPTPPRPPMRRQLMYGESPPRQMFDEGFIGAEEPEFLASPGFEGPKDVFERTPPDFQEFMLDEEDMFGLASPGLSPAPPTFPTTLQGGLEEVSLWDRTPLFGERGALEDVEEPMLASPEMPTYQDEIREIGSPVRLPPPAWPPQAPVAPVPAAVAPAPQPSPRAPSPRAPSPRRPVQIQEEAEEFDPERLRQELGQHVKVPYHMDAPLRAGRRGIPRRYYRNYAMIPIGEYMDWKESEAQPLEKIHRDWYKYETLPPMGAPPPLPTELMGEEYHGRYYHPDLIMDRPISPTHLTEQLPEPIEPEYVLHGYQTPPHLRTRPFEELAKSPEMVEADYGRTSSYRDPLLFEEPPEGVFGLTEEEVVPMELTGEGFMTPPIRPRMPMPYSPPTPTLPPRPPGIGLPRMTPEAAAHAQWQAQEIISAPRIPTPSPPRPPRTSPPRAPAPHWSPVAGPSSAPHAYPYAPPMSPPRAPSPPKESPRVTKRVKEVTHTTQVYDPESPETSTTQTRGKTTVEIKHPTIPEEEEEPADFGYMTAPVQVPYVPPEIPPPRPGFHPDVRRPRVRKWAGLPPHPEDMYIEEEFVRSELDYLPQHLRGFKWMDEEDDDSMTPFRERFKPAY